MIRFESVTFGYNEYSPIFENYSWEVAKGETWAVLGPSGCGKTTLLYLLAGLKPPISGSVIIDDQKISRPRPHTGLILQEYGLLPWATVRENAQLGMKVREYYGPDGTHTPIGFEARSNLDDWLERLGLIELADKYPSQLSGGQRQRTAIARTLALEPNLLLMDEPFSSLDAPSRERLQNLIVELKIENDLTLILVTHSIEEAAFLGKKILLLNQPPISDPLIIENPGANESDYRTSKEYQDICTFLRKQLDENLPIPTGFH